MILTAAQERVVYAVREWWHSRLIDDTDAEFVLAGYAGTGKTTLVRHFLEGLDARVVCVTPTGKSAAVLKSKMPEGAEISTIHSFIYQPVEVDDVRVDAARRELAAARQRGDKDETKRLEQRVVSLERMYQRGQCEFSYSGAKGSPEVVVVDECSMVDERMEADLRRTGLPIIFVGDGGQLPPVQGRSFFERNKPDAVLEEIHRQAADNPILRFATAVRLGKRFDDWGERCQLVRGARGASVKMLLGVDKVLTGTNNYRRALNSKMRKALFPATVRHVANEFDVSEFPIPVAGEELICLKNDNDLGLINGMPVWSAQDAQIFGGGLLRCELALTKEEKPTTFIVDDLAFRQYADPDARRKHRPEGPEFDFGHAITVHKAQGSEWPAVLVWDDGFGSKFPPGRRRWKYTAITRAAERLVWVDAVPRGEEI